MPNWLRQSTATTVEVGPLVEATDGYSYKATTITLASGSVIYFYPAAAATGILVAPSLPFPGWLRVPIAVSDTANCGPLMIRMGNVTNNLPVWREFLVVPGQVYDSMVLGTDLLQVDTQQINNTTATDVALKVATGVNVIQINGAAPTNTVFGVNLLTITGAAVSAAFAGYVIPVNVIQVTGSAPSNAAIGSVANLTTGVAVTSIAAGVGVNASSINGGPVTNITYNANLLTVTGASPSAALPQMLMDYVMFTPGVQSMTVKDTLKMFAAVLGGKEDGATGASMRFFGVSGEVRVSAQVVSGKRTGVTWVTG